MGLYAARAVYDPIHGFVHVTAARRSACGAARYGDGKLKRVSKKRFMLAANMAETVIRVVQLEEKEMGLSC